MRTWISGFILLVGLTGCCAYPAQSYVEADESTYNWAAPKLKEWAQSKDDVEWTEAVDAKLVSWKARYEKAKQFGEDTSE